MDYSAFSHGQIQSKLWLCENLEKIIPANSNIVILGSWYNILSFLLLVRKPNFYHKITGIEINKNNIEISNKICDAFIINKKVVFNIEADVNNIDLNQFDVIICTSTEDIQDDIWFQKIPKNKIVCLQTLNVDPNTAKKYEFWNIVNPNYNMEDFIKKYPMNEIQFQGEKEFDYGDLKYNRYMIIGKK
jgi:hypothetical protein